MRRFEGSIVLVTGGTRGIGLATAERLRSEGARVVVTASRDETLASARQTLGGDTLCIKNDAGSPHSAQTLIAALREHGIDRLDAAFLNAGFGRFVPLEQVTAAEFDEHFAVNVRGPLLHAQALVAMLKPGASVLLNSSVGARIGTANMAVYASTKAALRTLTRVLARELLPHGIRVNCISPGPIATDFMARAGMDAEGIAAITEWVERAVPMGRWGTPAEAASVAAFLLSNESTFVTGSDYTVDGGMTEL